jgi:radial spoke head protein 9
MRALGKCLNVQDKVKINLALKKLSLESRSDVTFWGVIYGKKNDYYIAKSVSYGESVESTFYVSSDCVNFSKLQAVDAWVARKSNLILQDYTGNMSHLYRDPEKPRKYNEDGEEEEDEEEEEEEDEEGEEGTKKPKERKLSELERISYTVQAIDYNCSIVPKGQFQLSSTGVITRNKHFAGLSASAAAKKENYVLFRDATNESTLAAIRKGGVSNIDDCFDSIADNSAMWALVKKGNEYSLRSLEWLGFEYTNGEGHYFGTGIKNFDVKFMAK